MCRLQGGLKGIIAYRIAKFKRKKKRRKVRLLLEAGFEYEKLRHDSV
jgi:hypothetical protein